MSAYQLLRKVGINANPVDKATAEAAGFDSTDALAALTPTQITKAKAMSLVDEIVGVAGTRMMIVVNLEALERAVAENAKAPRAGGGVTVEIERSTHYAFTVTGNEINDFTHAVWAGDAGYIHVNGLQIAIEAGEAGDFYEEPDDSDTWDPERTVYVSRFTAEADGVVSEFTLSSYGMTNLIRRFASFGGRIQQ